MGGRTNRVWQFDAGSNRRVLKLYAPDAESPLFPNQPEREVAALTALANSRLAPRLHAAGRTGTLSWLIYDHVPGDPWRREPEQVARLLGRLHRLPVEVQLPCGTNGSAEIEIQTDAMLAACAGPQVPEVSGLRPDRAVEPMRQPCLIHGDPVPGNILVDAETTVLIDWQCPSIGDPAEDIALFLSPAMQHIYRGKALSDNEVSAFLAAYPQRDTALRYLSLRPWFHWRMAAYCLWQTGRGCTDYAPGLQLELCALSALSPRR